MTARRSIVSLLVLAFSCAAPHASALFTTADFETPAEGATSVPLTGITVALTGQIAVRTSTVGSFGSGPSTKWIGTPLSPVTGAAGAITTATPGTGFRVKTVYVWTSNDAGSSNANGPITFTGTLASGATITETFAIAPTGFTGSDYQLVTFSSAIWSGATLSSLAVSIGAGINYVALDRLEYEANPLSPCAPNPCQNAGVCTVLSATTFACACATGWSGTTCTTDVNECLTNNGGCLNASVCTNTAGSRTCTCTAAYSGATCATDVNECLVSNGGCLNGAACVNSVGSFACVCPSGFSGPSCATDVNECATNNGGCLNGGVCTNTVGSSSCTCPATFSGPTCASDVNECATNNGGCLNGATCVNSIGSFTCTCATGFMGPSCAADVDECLTNNGGCLNGGTCANSFGSSSCTCLATFTGATCATDVDECATDNGGCVNGATCTNAVGSFSCACVGGFTGPTCAVEVNECDPNPCVHGTCADEIGAYSCDCTGTGFSGANCDVSTDDAGIASDAGVDSGSDAGVVVDAALHDGASPDGGEAPAPAAGCACSVPGAPSRAPLGGALVVTLAALLGARRRARRVR